jgi:NitT/TauT family transport system permease protein
MAATLTALGYFGSVDWTLLIRALAETTYRLALAYALALVLGTVLGLMVGWTPFLDGFFTVFDVIQNIPSFALIPFFIYFFGYTDRMIILFAMTSIIWPILFAILTAIKTAHTDLSDAARIFGATGFRRVLYYLAPLSVPAMLTGSVVGIAIGWEAVIGAEIIVHIAGFGSFIESASQTGITETTLAGLVAILILVFLINRVVWLPLLAESSKRFSE